MQRAAAAVAALARSLARALAKFSPLFSLSVSLLFVAVECKKSARRLAASVAAAASLLLSVATATAVAVDWRKIFKKGKVRGSGQQDKQKHTADNAETKKQKEFSGLTRHRLLPGSNLRLLHSNCCVQKIVKKQKEEGKSNGAS